MKVSLWMTFIISCDHWSWGLGSMTTKIDLNKDIIVPNKKAAGVKLGAKKETIKKNWGKPIEIEKISSKVERWGYENVNFWLVSGKVDQISLCNLYEGKTKEGVGLGSTKAEVEKVYGPLEWDGSWHIQIPPFGIGFDFISEIIGEQFVSEVYVFMEYY